MTGKNVLLLVFFKCAYPLKTILFIKIGALGDLSYALPAAKALKNSLPCHVTWVVGRSCAAFLQEHASIDRLVIIDDKKLYSKNILVRLLELAKLYWQLHQRFDCVIITHRDPTYYQAFKWLSRDTIFQLSREKKAKHLVTIEPLTTHESLAIKKLTLAAIQHYISLNDIAWEWDYSHIPTTKLKLPKQSCILHLGGGSNSKTEFRLKCWPHWQELISKLLEQTDLHLVFVGATSEKMENKIKEKYYSRCINLIGMSTLSELVDVIRQCDFFIGVDSGPLHIADSMEKPIIGLFGPTSTISWGLLSSQGKALNHTLPCSPCYKDNAIFPECQFQHRCMTSLGSQQVFEAFHQLQSKCCR